MADVLIATDGGSFYKQWLYIYNGILYQFIPDVNNFSTTTKTRAYKSSNGGATWAAVSSTIQTSLFFQTIGACVLIGTKLYIWYVATPGSAVVLAYFDFTTETFSAAGSTSNPTVFSQVFLAAASASPIFNSDQGGGGGAAIAQYLSLNYTAIGSLTPAGSYVQNATEVLFLGSSGILHILYVASTSAGLAGTSDLGYANVISGTLHGTVGSNIVVTGFSDSTPVDSNGFISQPIQIGSNIIFPYYDPTAQKLKLLSFTDVSSPVFTVTVIDPALTITVVAHNPSGGYDSVLAYFNSILYCFYTNSDLNGGGDGNVYVRMSTDSGATWSARSVVIQHKDPADLTAFAVWFLQSMVIVGTPGAISTIEISYQQVIANSRGANAAARFAFGYVAAVESARNYVLS